jgi:hypothetical protein
MEVQVYVKDQHLSHVSNILDKLSNILFYYFQFV